MTYCAIPGGYDHIVLGHGGGGRLTDELVRTIFLPAFGNPTLDALEDQATLAIEGGRIALTTDAFVVSPLFFPGGDIGKLAVCGTVNDLAVGGAIPRWLTATFILEEGLPLETLARVAQSMRRAADEAGVVIVAGDTKVVDRGKGDGIFITTSGVGVVPPDVSLSVSNVRAGDRVIVSGPIGDHGVAILSVREGLAFESEIVSDCAPLGDLVRALFETCGPSSVRCMRDPTRGGLASVLHEMARASNVSFVLDERTIPLSPQARGACELFGLDPLHVACEGRLVAIADRSRADDVVAALRAHPLGKDATIVGEVIERAPVAVSIRSMLGETRVVSALSGEILPRIC
jgi:hydrogenase expression/formation protein HypE